MTMKFKVSRADMWSATIEDQPGGAARVLDPVAKAGANFEFAFARRAPELPGKGLLFVLPVKGAKVLQAAQAAGLAKAEGIHTLRVEGADKPGASAAIVRALANAGRNPLLTGKITGNFALSGATNCALLLVNARPEPISIHHTSFLRKSETGN
jgi:hypothetical protein